ncbi:MAG: phosphoribosylaminoimidazolesuccinocarboxamide synthase [Chloroflexi bacterium]|nr:phosphoribosylaminoimidazolesuccinocarboxamide synthase [Chloroflexota bacterium]
MPPVESFIRSGKVRDLYQLSERRVALVASDRISAFDVVLPTTIPDKGRVLTGLSRFWFGETAGIVANHLLGWDPAVVAGASGLGVGELRGRTMLCREAEVIPVEAVVRGHLAGSGWKEYRDHGTLSGTVLPAWLREADLLPGPQFTPATKAPLGEHDENIDFDAMVERIASMPGLSPGAAGAIAEVVRDAALRLYGYGAAIAARAGLLLADTKFEFGLLPDDGADVLPGALEARVILIDEVLTPDSSRFWDAATFTPGRTQASFDKQFVRDWLETRAWDKTDPGPALPPDIVDGTRARYVEAFERITGASFARYLEDDVVAR